MTYNPNRKPPGAPGGTGGQFDYGPTAGASPSGADLSSNRPDLGEPVDLSLLDDEELDAPRTFPTASFTNKNGYVFPEGTVTFDQAYADGSNALIYEYPDGDREIFSVNMAGYGMYTPPGQVFIPDYGEHEGVAEALEDQGIVSLIHPIRIGYGEGYLADVNVFKNSNQEETE